MTDRGAGRQRGPSTDAGTTLVELVITLAVFAMIVVVVIGLWEQSQRAYFQGATAAELQQNVRVALEQIAREIRQAGYDPCRYLTTCTSAFDPVVAGVFPIQAFTAGSLWVRMDRDGDGSVTDGDPDESVCFYVGGGVLRRKTTGGDCASGGDELARNITGLAFTYLRADGTAAAAWSEVRLVRVTLSSQETFMGEPLTVSLRSDVRLRDR
jgi:type IV pilus assembly protein PilW